MTPEARRLLQPGKMLLALDPYFPSTFQPVHLTRDELASVWSGQVEFVEHG